ncbi:MAG: transporter substrate-binding domain-containing protein [Spirochaetaceae bacterium]|jgi:hypothetical protein|nr:transporter substrate-binding domain-containing protein [Spirochaetaceae bacterium]
MKKAEVLILIIIILNMTDVYSQNTGKITVGIIDLDSDAVYLDENVIKGHIGKLFQCTLENSQLEYSIIQLPLARLIKYVESGIVDIGIPMANTEERDQFAFYAIRQIEIPYVIVTLDQSLKPGDSLAGKEISSLNVSNLIGFIEAPDVRINRVKSYEQALSLVLAEHTYGAIVPTDMLVGFDEINDSTANIVHWGTHYIGFYVSDKSPFRELIIEALNRGFNICSQ